MDARTRALTVFVFAVGLPATWCGLTRAATPNLASASVPSASLCPFDQAPATDPDSFCTSTSWTAGIAEICKGHIVYRDYIYDDNGASGATPIVGLPTSGATYPEGAENTADLVRLELWRKGGRVRVEFELNTLYTSGQSFGAVAVDKDNDPATGGGPWPGVNVASQGWDAVYVFREADPDSNLITGEFPEPVSDAWKIWAVVAQSDGTVMNVAFRGVDETPGAWFDGRQAAALAAGDVSEFGMGVCRSDLRPSLTRGVPRATGYHERVYTSAYTLPPGEGLSVGGIPGPRVKPSSTDPRVYQSFNFLGRYQPYAFYQPAQPGPHGLQLTLHGFGGTHTGGAAGDASAQSAFGDSLNRVLISPLGRGQSGAYSDISERDVLDVLADAKRYFDIDESRVVVSGISMGGYGELHFGVLYPDLFAGMVGWVPPTGNFDVFPTGEPLTYYADSLPANTAQMVRNLRHVPHVQIYGAFDEFVPVFEAEAMRQQLIAEDSGEFDFFIYSNTDHVTTYGFDQTREAQLGANWRRPDRVARVTYRKDSTLETPAYGLFHDRAYWVRAIRERGAGYADVDLTSFGCGLATPVTTQGEDTGVGTGGVAAVHWLRTYRRIIADVPTATSNRIAGNLKNVASLRIDLDAACLKGRIDYDLETDGATVLSLSDGRQIALPSSGRFVGRVD